MMLDWLLPAPSERRLLGGERKRGATPWVIAIMSFSIVIVAAAGLALSNAASQVGRSVENRYSVQVPGGGGALERLVAAIRAAPGVTSVEAVPEAEMRATLARWLGPAAESQHVPIALGQMGNDCRLQVAKRGLAVVRKNLLDRLARSPLQFDIGIEPRPSEQRILTSSSAASWTTWRLVRT